MRSRLLIILAVPLFFLIGCQDEKVVSKKITDKDSNLHTTLFEIPDVQKNIHPIEHHKTGLKFKSQKGKVVLANFFATWCPSCRDEMPELNALQARYGDDLQIVGVLLDKEISDAKIHAFIEKYEMNFIVLYSDDTDVLSRAVGVTGAIPHSIMYDKNGNFFTQYVGPVREERVEADLEKALAVN